MSDCHPTTTPIDTCAKLSTTHRSSVPNLTEYQRLSGAPGSGKMKHGGPGNANGCGGALGDGLRWRCYGEVDGGDDTICFGNYTTKPLTSN